MSDKVRIFKANNEVYHIPEKDVEAFKGQYPDAVEGSVYLTNATPNRIAKKLFVSEADFEEKIKKYPDLAFMEGVTDFKKKSPSSGESPKPSDLIGEKTGTFKQQPRQTQPGAKAFHQEDAVPITEDIAHPYKFNQPETQEEQPAEESFQPPANPTPALEQKSDTDKLKKTAFPLTFNQAEQDIPEIPKNIGEMNKAFDANDIEAAKLLQDVEIPYDRYQANPEAAKSIQNIDKKYRSRVDGDIFDYLTTTQDGFRDMTRLSQRDGKYFDEEQKQLVTKAISHGIEKAKQDRTLAKLKFSVSAAQMKELTNQIAKKNQDIQNLNITTELQQQAKDIAKNPNRTQEDVAFLESYNQRVSQAQEIGQTIQELTSKLEETLQSPEAKDYEKASENLRSKYENALKFAESLEQDQKDIHSEGFDARVPGLYQPKSKVAGGVFVDAVMSLVGGANKAVPASFLALTEAYKDLIYAKDDPRRWLQTGVERMAESVIYNTDKDLESIKITDDNKTGLYDEDGNFSMYGLALQTIKAAPNFFYFARVVPILKAAGMSEAGSTGLATYVGFYGDNYQQAQEMGLTGLAATQYSAISTGAEALSERIFPNYKIFQSTIRRDLMKAYAKGVASSAAAEAHEAGLKQLTKEAPQIIGKIAARQAGQAGLESMEEAVMLPMEMVNKSLTNFMYNTELENKWATGKEFVEATLPVFVLTFLTGVGVDINEMSAGQAQVLDFMVDDYNMSNQILAEIKLQDPSADIDRVKTAMQIYEAYKSRMPQEMNGENAWKRPILAVLLRDQDKIRQDMAQEGLDPSIVAVYEGKLKEVQANMAKIIDAKRVEEAPSEFTEEETVVQPLTPQLAELAAEEEVVSEEKPKEAALVSETTPDAISSIEATAKALDGVDENIVSKITEKIKGIFYTGRGKKYEDLAKTKGDFIFFSENKKNASWYGGDDTNVSEAFIDDSEYLDLTSQDKKAKFVDENFTDNDIEKLYPEIKTKAFEDRDVRKSYEQKLKVEIDKKREQLRENRFSGDTKEQKFLLQKAKDLGVKGIKLLDTFFGESDISTIAIDKSTIRNLNSQSISEAYHKAKAEGVENDLTRAVEELLGKKADPAQPELETSPKKQPPQERIKEIDESIETLRRERPNEFKKDGTPKAKSKLAPSYKAMIDMRAQAVEDMMAIEATEDTKSETEKISKDFEERQKELEKWIPEGELFSENIDNKIREGQELTQEEVDYINENFFIPDGFKYDKTGSLVKRATQKTKQDKKTEDSKGNSKNTVNLQNDTEATKDEERKQLIEGNPILSQYEFFKGTVQGAISQDARFAEFKKQLSSELVLDNLDQKLGEEDANGTESLVWFNEDGHSVTKAISYDLEGGIDNLIDKILVHNATFPETQIEVIGIGTLSDGTNVFIANQPLIIFSEQSALAKEEIISFMAENGFHVVEDDKYPKFSNGVYEIADLHEGNIGRTVKGNIAVIDFFADIVTRNNQKAKQDKETSKPTEDTTQETIEPQSEKEIAAKKLADKIRAKKIRGAGVFIDFGITTTILNAAIELIAQQIERGTKLGKAIANAIQFIDSQMNGIKWDKAGFAKAMHVQYSVTLPKFHIRGGEPAIGFDYHTEKTARERFNIPMLEKIGSGSDRDVYRLSDGKVVKIAKTARGLEQNIHEGDGLLVQEGIIPEMFEQGLNYVVVEDIPRAKSSDMVSVYDQEQNEVGQARFADMIRDLQSVSQTDFNRHNGKAQDVLYMYGFEMLLSYNVIWADFAAARNWGYKDGKAYHVDGGTFGGIDLITSYRGKKNLEDADFREVYYKSRAQKKEFGDTDKNTKYQIIGQNPILSENVRNNLAVAREMEDARQPRTTPRPDTRAVNNVLSALGNILGNMGIITDPTEIDRVFKAMGKQGKVIPGFVYDGNIYIDTRIATAETPLHEIVGHVLTAWAKDNNPKLHEKIMELADDVPQDVQDHVAENYPKLEGEDLKEELFSTYVGRLLKGQYETKGNRTFFQKVMDWIREAVAELSRWFSRNYRYVELKAEDFANDTIDEFITKIADLAMANRIRFDNVAKRLDLNPNIIGEIGAKVIDELENTAARITALETAKSMSEKGVSQEEIFAKTGWQNIEGFWKYEADYVTIKDPENLLLEIMSAYEYETTIGEVLEGEMLKYPKYAKLKIKLSNEPSKNKGVYDPEEERITIYLPETLQYGTKAEEDILYRPEHALRRLRDVIIHESQHFVQATEGFHYGGSPVAAKKRLNKEEYLANKEEALKELLQILDEQIKLTPEDESLQKKYDTIDRKLTEISEGTFNWPFEAYRDFTGEVEARLAEKRANMTLDERRQIVLEAMMDRTPKERVLIARAISTALSYSPVYDEAAEAKYNVPYNSADFENNFKPAVKSEDVFYIPLTAELKDIEKSLLFSFQAISSDKAIARQFAIAVQNYVLNTGISQNTMQQYFGIKIQEALTDKGEELRGIAVKYRFARTDAASVIFGEEQGTFAARNLPIEEAWFAATGVPFDQSALIEPKDLMQKNNMVDADIWDAMKDYILSSFRSGVYDFNEIAAALITQDIVTDETDYQDLIETYVDVTTQMEDPAIGIDGVNNINVITSKTPRTRIPSLYDLTQKIREQEAKNQLEAQNISLRNDTLSTFGVAPRPLFTGANRDGGGTFFDVQPPLKYITQSWRPLKNDWRIESKYPKLSSDQSWAVASILDRFNGGGKAFLLADGPGVGKTAIIMATAIEWAQKSGRPVLVVTQNEQIVQDRFNPDAANILGYTGGLPINIVSYEGMKKLVATGQSEHYGMVAYDEAHALQNPTSDRSMAAANIVADHVLFSTATPFEKLWGMDYFMPKLLNISQDRFRSAMGYKVEMQSKRDFQKKTTEIVPVIVPTREVSNKELRDAVLQMRAIVLAQGAMIKREFPFWGNIEILSYPQRDEDSENEAIVDEYWQTKIEHAKTTEMKMNYGGQRANELSRLNEPSKLPIVVRMIDHYLKTNNKVIIFVSNISDDTEIKGLGRKIPTITPALKSYLEKNVIKYGMVGQQTVAKKRNDAKKFQNDEVDVLIATYESAATGIDLDDQRNTKPRVVIAATINYSASVFQQAMYRVSRRNTKSPSKFIGIANTGKSDTRRAQILETKASVLTSIQAGRMSEDIDTMFSDTKGSAFKVKEKAPYLGTWNNHPAVFNDWAIKDKLDAIPGIRWNGQRGEKSARVIYRQDYLPAIEAIIAKHEEQSHTGDEKSEQALKDLIQSLKDDMGYMGSMRFPFKSLYNLARVSYYQLGNVIDNLYTKIGAWGDIDAIINMGLKLGNFIDSVIAGIKKFLSSSVQLFDRVYKGSTKAVRSLFDNVIDSVVRTYLGIADRKKLELRDYNNEPIFVKHAFEQMYNQAVSRSTSASDFVIEAASLISSIASGVVPSALRGLSPAELVSATKYLNSLAKDVDNSNANTLVDVEQMRRFMTATEVQSDVAPKTITSPSTSVKSKSQTLLDNMRSTKMDVVKFVRGNILANRKGLPLADVEKDWLRRLGVRGRGMPLDRSLSMKSTNAMLPAKTYASRLLAPVRGKRGVSPKLSNVEYDLFNEMIFYTRAISRLERDIATGNMTLYSAEKGLEAVRIKLKTANPSREWSDFENRLDAYDKATKENLKTLLNTGYINQVQYDKLTANFYAPFAVISTTYSDMSLAASGNGSRSILYHLKGIKDGAALWAAVMNTYNAIWTDLINGNITLEDAVIQITEMAWEEYKSGAISEDVFKQIQAEISSSGFEIHDLLEATDVLFQKTFQIAALQEEYNYIYSIGEALEQMGATDVQIITLEAAKQHTLLKGEGMFRLRHQGRDMVMIMDEDAAKVLTGAKKQENEVLYRLIQAGQIAGLAWLLNINVIAASAGFIAGNYAADTLRTLYAPSAKGFNLTSRKKGMAGLINLMALPFDAIASLLEALKVQAVETGVIFQEKRLIPFAKTPLVTKGNKLEYSRLLPERYQRIAETFVAPTQLSATTNIDKLKDNVGLLYLLNNILGIPLNVTEKSSKILAWRRHERFYKMMGIIDPSQQDWMMDVGINSGTPYVADSRNWVALANVIMPFFRMRWGGAIDDMASFTEAITGGAIDAQGKHYGTTTGERLRSGEAINTLFALSTLFLFKYEQFNKMTYAEMHMAMNANQYALLNRSSIYQFEDGKLQTEMKELPMGKKQPSTEEATTRELREGELDSIPIAKAYQVPARGAVGMINFLLDRIAFAAVTGDKSGEFIGHAPYEGMEWLLALSTASPIELEGMDASALFGGVNPAIKIGYEWAAAKNAFTQRPRIYGDLQRREKKAYEYFQEQMQDEKSKAHYLKLMEMKYSMDMLNGENEVEYDSDSLGEMNKITFPYEIYNAMDKSTEKYIFDLKKWSYVLARDNQWFMPTWKLVLVLDNIGQAATKDRFTMKQIENRFKSSAFNYDRTIQGFRIGYINGDGVPEEIVYQNSIQIRDALKRMIKMKNATGETFNDVKLVMDWELMEKDGSFLTEAKNPIIKEISDLYNELTK